MGTLGEFVEAEGTISKLTSMNNSLVNTEANYRLLIDRIAALSAPDRTTLDTELVALGADVASFDALITSLTTVLDSITANLSTIKKEV